MRRPDTGGSGTPGNSPFPDEDWLKRFPNVCCYLADRIYDDGAVRDPSSVSIKEQDGLVLATLSDVDLQRGLYRTGKNVREAVEAIEKALAGNRADWRPWRPSRGGKGK